MGRRRPETMVNLFSQEEVVSVDRQDNQLNARPGTSR